MPTSEMPASHALKPVAVPLDASSAAAKMTVRSHEVKSIWLEPSEMIEGGAAAAEAAWPRSLCSHARG